MGEYDSRKHVEGVYYVSIWITSQDKVKAHCNIVGQIIGELADLVHAQNIDVNKNVVHNMGKYGLHTK